MVNPKSPDKYRVGLVFHGYGRKIPVDGIKGAFTTHDNKIGQQVYWFKDLAEFEAKKKTIWLQKYLLGAPIPIVELLETSGDVTPAELVQKIISGKDPLPADARKKIVAWLRQTPMDTKDLIKVITTPIGAVTAEQGDRLVAHAEEKLKDIQDKLSPAEVEKPQIPSDFGAVAETSSQPEPEKTEAVKHSDAMADFVFKQHAGRKIRIKDFAVELDITPEELQPIIAKDPRYAPIAAGWVRLADQGS